MGYNLDITTNYQFRGSEGSRNLRSANYAPTNKKLGFIKRRTQTGTGQRNEARTLKHTKTEYLRKAAPMSAITRQGRNANNQNLVSGASGHPQSISI